MTERLWIQILPVLGFVSSLSHQYCDVTQVSHGGATPLVFLKKFLAMQLEKKQAIELKNKDKIYQPGHSFPL